MLSEEEVLTYVKNALKSGDTTRMDKALSVYTRWSGNYLDNLPIEILDIINTITQNKNNIIKLQEKMTYYNNCDIKYKNCIINHIKNIKNNIYKSFTFCINDEDCCACQSCEEIYKFNEEDCVCEKGVYIPSDALDGIFQCNNCYRIKYTNY